MLHVGREQAVEEVTWETVMKRLNNSKMRKALKRAAKKVGKPPSDGSMLSLLYGDINKDGEHWQVEYIHDTRFRPEPYIAAYRWRKRGVGATIAQYVLTGDVKGRPHVR